MPPRRAPSAITQANGSSTARHGSAGSQHRQREQTKNPNRSRLGFCYWGGVYPTILWKPYGATASRVATAKIPANVPIPVRDALQRGTRRVDPRNASSRASSSAQSVASPSRSHGEGLGMWPVWGGWSAVAGRSVVVIQSVLESGRDKGVARMVAPAAGTAWASFRGSPRARDVGGLGLPANLNPKANRPFIRQSQALRTCPATGRNGRTPAQPTQHRARRSG